MYLEPKLFKILLGNHKNICLSSLVPPPPPTYTKVRRQYFLFVSVMDFYAILRLDFQGDWKYYHQIPNYGEMKHQFSLKP